MNLWNQATFHWAIHIYSFSFCRLYHSLVALALLALHLHVFLCSHLLFAWKLPGYQIGILTHASISIINSYFPNLYDDLMCMS